MSLTLLTGLGDTESRLKGFAVGSQDYVPKPFALDELRARVRAHLNVKQRLDKGHFYGLSPGAVAAFQQQALEQITGEAVLKALFDAGETPKS